MKDIEAPATDPTCPGCSWIHGSEGVKYHCVVAALVKARAELALLKAPRKCPACESPLWARAQLDWPNGPIAGWRCSECLYSRSEADEAIRKSAAHGSGIRAPAEPR